MRSARTTQEFHTAAMLLGKDWSYDHVDHTFVGTIGSAGDVFSFPILDADTMAPIEIGDEIKQRVELVQKGLLGPSDAYPTQLQREVKRPDQMPHDGEDDPPTAAASRGSTSRR